MPLTIPEIVYVATILAIGGYGLLRTLRFLQSSRRLRIRNVERRPRFESVGTDSPIANPKAVAVERGVESIESHFSVLRRLLLPLIAFLTLLLASVPFFAGASATTASLLGTVIAVVLGIALRPFFENAVAGLVISGSQLVRIGDTVRIDDLYGTVEDITATHTAVKLWDWRRYLVPNGRMLQSPMVNYSLFDSFQWAYVEFWVAPDADLDLVREIAVKAPLESPHFSRREDPAFWIIRIERDAICCWVAAWVDSPAAAWGLTHDVRSEILRELRRQHIPTSLQRHHWSPETPSSTDALGPGSREAPR